MPQNYPLLLDVTDRQIVIVGGGEVAVRKAKGLLEAGARQVRVVAPVFHEQMPAGVQRVAEPYRREHLADANLVFVATDDPAVNDAVVGNAKELGVLVCRADASDKDTGDKNAGDFATPAMIRRGPVLVTVSTSGSPALAAKLRDAIEQKLELKWIKMAEMMQTLRPKIHAIDSLAPSRRREIFMSLASDEALQMIEMKGADALKTWLINRYPELAGIA